jgi:hypothetical protein
MARLHDIACETIWQLRGEACEKGRRIPELLIFFAGPQFPSKAAKARTVRAFVVSAEIFRRNMERVFSFPDAKYQDAKTPFPF